MESAVARVRDGLIVSCQTEAPLDGADYIARLASVMIEGGAAGVRINGPHHVRAVRERVDAPVIGIHKRRHPGFRIFITPTRRAVQEMLAAGADIVALDATEGPRPDGSTVRELIDEIHGAGILAMADISTADEASRAYLAGADVVATTLSGYTPHSPALTQPDFDLLSELTRTLPVPIIAEGRYHRPELVEEAFRRGAFAVVVGRAITEPKIIVQPFVGAANRKREDRR